MDTYPLFKTYERLKDMVLTNPGSCGHDRHAAGQQGQTLQAQTFGATTADYSFTCRGKERNTCRGKDRRTQKKKNRADA